MAQVPDVGGAGSEIDGAGFKTQPRPAPRICLLRCSDGAGSGTDGAGQDVSGAGSAVFGAGPEMDAAGSGVQGA